MTDQTGHRARSTGLIRGIVGIVVCSLASGCAVLGGSAGGEVKTSSIADEPAVLRSSFTDAIYEHIPAAETSFFLTDVPTDSLMDGSAHTGQVLHVDLLWQPRPGATPMDATATNLSIRLLILSNGEAGLYEGGGFGVVTGDLGSGTATITVRDSTLRLSASTSGFTDLLTPARIDGKFTAKPDSDRARTIRLSASQFVTNLLGRTAFVRNGHTPSTTPG